jgi:putative ABC transport system permease protein
VWFFVYIYRSLIARARANTFTVLAIALLVTGGSLGLAYYRNLDRMLVQSATPEDVIVLAKGAPSEEDSQLDLESANKVAVLDGIRSEGAVRLVARELVSFVYLNTADFSRYYDATPIRGIDAASFAVHRAHVIAGSPPQDGTLQVVLGRRIAKRFPELKLGDDVYLPGGAARISGLFEAGGSPHEDEVWTPRAALENHIKTKTSTSMSIVATDAAHAAALVDKINSSKDLEVQASPLSTLREHNAGLRTVVKIVLLMLLLLLLVATFSIATTMNAAVAVRLPELAAIAAIGIRKKVLARVVLAESVLLALAGAVLGVIAGELVRSQVGILSLGESPLELVAMASVPLVGVGLALVAGLSGGLAPSLRVRRMSIVDTLR